MIIPTFQRGSSLSAADLNLAMDAVRRARVLPGVGIKLTETVNGTVVSLKPQRLAGGGAVETIFPWQIYSSPYLGTGSAPEDQKLKVKVRQGIINNKIQGNLNEEFTCSETCDIYAEASLTYSEDGGYATVVSHVVKKGSVPETETGLRPAKVYLAIASVVVEDGEITQILQFIRGYVSGAMVMGASNCTSQSRQWTWFVQPSEF